MPQLAAAMAIGAPATALGGLLLHAAFHGRRLPLRAICQAMEGGGDASTSPYSHNDANILALLALGATSDGDAVDDAMLAALVSGTSVGDLLDVRETWSPRTAARVRGTYLLFGAQIAGTAAVFTLANRSGLTAALMAWRPAACITGLVAAGAVCCHVLHRRTTRRTLLILHCAIPCVYGMLLSPVCCGDGTCALASAAVTTALTLPLCALAALSPSTTYLSVAGPVSVALAGLTTIASLRFGYSVSPFSTSLYQAGLAMAATVYAVCALHDASQVVHRAIHFDEYDPVGESLYLFCGALNVCDRVSQLLNDGAERRHRRRSSSERLAVD